MIVAVRVRPLTSRETDAGVRSCCTVLRNSIVAIRKEGAGAAYLKSEKPRTNEYAFDVAFDDAATQGMVYEQTAKRFVPKLLGGLNVTVFCYGSTGAGKVSNLPTLFKPKPVRLIFCIHSVRLIP